MKLVGKWFVPNYEENLRVLTAVENEDWGCKETLKKSFKYIQHCNRRRNLDWR